MRYRYIYTFLVAIYITAGAEESKDENTKLFEAQCLSCHQAQQVPSEIIYRRYLMRYSSKELIKRRMIAYLKTPSIASSIMPAPFFRKFPLKKTLSIEQRLLEKMVEEYIARYSLDGKIIIQSQKSN